MAFSPQVRSFGTEGRPTAKPIQPRNEVYEFIIFRGNDIKDLNVSEMPGQQSENPVPPQDPAILSAVGSVTVVWMVALMVALMVAMDSR